MLVSAAAYLAKINPTAAQKLIDTFEEAVQSLETMPYRCPWLNAECLPVNKYHSLLFDRRYLLIFLIRDKTVYVDYVVDCRQDYLWLLQ